MPPKNYELTGGRLFMCRSGGTGEHTKLGSPISFDMEPIFDSDEVAPWPTGPYTMSFETTGYINPFVLAILMGFRVSNNALKRHHRPMRRKSARERWGGRYAKLNSDKEETD